MTIDLSRAVKPIDCWWTVAAVDPVAVRVLPWLVRIRRLTPDVVTSIAFGVGMVAVAMFALGHYRTGAGLYELRFFLDCLDGKIARVRRLASPSGAVMDRLADSVTIPAAYAALGLSLASRGLLSARSALLPALLCAMVVVAELSLELIRRAPGAATPLAASNGTGGLTGWMRRHRLTARPWTVEAETAGLFLAPLVLSGSLLGSAELVVAVVYVVFFAVDLALILLETRRGQR